MVTSDIATVEPTEVSQQVLPDKLQRRKLLWQKAHKLHWMTWLCLLLACLGTSWFSYQYFLVPQPANYAPNWGHSQWVQAADGSTPVAYFRYITDLNVLPDGAFITVASSQNFRLYVNGTFVGSNSSDFVQGIFPRAYMYDVASLLQPGSNALALRVANIDQQKPSVRVSLGIVRGNSVYYQGSGYGWVATAQSAAAHPRYATNSIIWTTSDFDASAWPPVQQAATPSIVPMLVIDPQIYERPISTHWTSAGVGHEAYFVRQISLPFGITKAWLRLVASGTAHVFINGHLFIVWNSQAIVPPQNLADYLSNSRAIVRYRTGFVLGVYDISPYLHAGVNTIAVHILAPGVSAARVGLDNLNAAMSLDMLIDDFQGHGTWLGSDTGWHASPGAVEGWEQGSNGALAWQAPISVGRPGANHTFYLPDSANSRSTQLIPLSLLTEVILLSIGAVVGLWLLMSLFVMRRYYFSRYIALEAMSLAFLPAIACETMLIVLSREPQIPLPRPFPYTWFWACLLILLVGVSYLFLWLYVRAAQKHTNLIATRRMHLQGAGLYKINLSRWHFLDHILRWLRVHWAFVLVVLLAIPLISYNLAYEPYWQDELTSYYAAKGILAHGLPIMPSGFLYPKGELYSYLLALSLAIFGDQGGAPRIVTIAEYLMSLPLIYGIGCYFFQRRVALLATAMLAFSPITLVWGRQVRMYEQVQILTPLVLYLFYKALQEQQRIRYVYLAVGCLIVNYLSHEETFIILPALVLCVLVASRDRTHRLPAILYQKHWWYAAAIGAGVIALQLLIVRVTHPPILGTDQSQRPLIQFTTDNVPFYIKLLFFPMALDVTLPWIMVNSLLATAGCIWAFWRGDARAKYCALFLIISFLTLMLMFTLASERYIYPILPIYYLIGAYTLLTALRALWMFVRSRIVLLRSKEEPDAQEMMPLSLQARWTADTRLSLPIRMMTAFTLALVYICVLIMPMLPISNYNLFISQVSGLSYHRHYPDYDALGQYMQHHWQKGDVVITVSPAISILYYVGHVDYFFSVNRALYLFERNGHIIDTPTGSTALLNQQDFQSVVASHTRIWIISDNGLYQSQVTRDRRFIFPSDFHLVYEGYGSAIFFRGS